MVTKQGIILTATAAVVTTIGLTGAGIHQISEGQPISLFSNSPKELIDEVWQVIDQSYVDGTFNQQDWRAVRKEYLSKNYKSKAEVYTAIREMLKKLNDPYTRFMDPEEFKNMRIDTSGELTGVGIQLAQDEETKKLVVVSPIEDTPAYKAGILAKDFIVKIDGKSTKGMDVNDAVKLIRGKAGTTVKLTIQRGTKNIDYLLTRARIEIHPVRYTLKNTNTGKIGYIRLNQFSANAGSEMSEAIKKGEKDAVVGYILDLRSNPGGLLYTSVEIARMWIPEGKIVSTVERKGETDLHKANNKALTDKPLVVIVDGGSASASEILSGALKDNKRAQIIGTKTFGKGLVQSVRPLPDGSGLAVTIAKYYTPNGTDINKKGIIPDVKLELTDEQRKALQKNRDRIGTNDDPQYAKAMQVLNQQIANRSGKQAGNSNQ